MYVLVPVIVRGLAVALGAGNIPGQAALVATISILDLVLYRRGSSYSLLYMFAIDQSIFIRLGNVSGDPYETTHLS